MNKIVKIGHTRVSDKKHSIICFGAVAIDIFVTDKGFNHISDTFNDLSPNVLGGQAANFALAIQKQGHHSVRLISALGHDSEGVWAKEQLIQNGIDITSVEIKETHSLKMRIHLTDPVRMEKLSDHHSLQELSANNPDFDNVSLAIAHATHAWDRLLSFMDQCIQAKIPLIFNPSPCTLLQNLLPIEKADLVIANETEAKHLCAQLNINISNMNVFSLPAVLQHKTGKDFIITYGEKGAVAACGNEVFFAPPRSVNVVDPTGAGDTFIGVFASNLLDGKSIKECLHQATAASSIVCERIGSSFSPTQKEIMDIIHETPEPLVIRNLIQHSDIQKIIPRLKK